MTNGDTLDAIAASINRSAPGLDAEATLAPLRARLAGDAKAREELELLLIDFAALGILTAYKAGLAAHNARQAPKPEAAT